MAMLLTDEQNMLRDAARGFLQASAPIDQLRRLRDEASSDGYDRDTWKSMTEIHKLVIVLNSRKTSSKIM